MTLRELVNSVEIGRVLKILKSFHEDSWSRLTKEAYEGVINELRQVPYKEGGLKSIEVQSDHDVYGIAEDPSLLEKGLSPGAATLPVGLDFVDWSKLVEVPIESKLGDDAWTLAAILYEITFYGFSREAIAKRREEFINRVNEPEIEDFDD